MKVLFFVLITLGTFHVHAQGALYKSTDKITLSYEEFRALTPENQEAWIKELRAFNHNIELIESGQRISAKPPKYSSIFPWMMERLQANQKFCAAFQFLTQSTPAYAADEKCQVRNFSSPSRICIYCPGDEVSGVNVCSASGAYSDSSKITQELMRAFENKDYRGARVGIDVKKLEEHVKHVQEEGGAFEFQTPVIRRDTVVKKVVTPSSSQPVVIDMGPDAKVEKPTGAGPITTFEKRDSTGAVLERKSNDRRVEDYKLKELGDIGGIKSNDNLDVDEVTSKDRLACIYAGWALQGKNCSPVFEKEVFDASGKKVTYSCKTPPKEGAIQGDTEDGKATVLCNPVVFGVKEGKPICTVRAKNATEECAKKSPPAKEALDFARNNPQSYRALVRRVDTLCQQDEGALRSHFAKRGYNEKRIEHSVKDLGATCSHLRGRMAELVQANKDTAPRAGVR
ncbi:hypothetical protein [uncultured Bdellovibrio sp.]|uniref:hypothetical protein n=1 Tax=Bdellovibrio sp. HCB-162 TaxID=3394234 RepID=UPI0025CBCA68|nr:hypothetical protein [uncultured Bdellovibrio sp.]